jgi:hypothetical protein
MTSVNITTTKNTVTVNEGNTTVVTVATQGPQGPAISGVNFDISGKVNDAVLYYHAASDTIKADNTTTKLTLVDGGNF